MWPDFAQWRALSVEPDQPRASCGIDASERQHTGLGCRKRGRADLTNVRSDSHCFASELCARGVERLRHQCAASNEHELPAVPIRRGYEHGARRGKQQSPGGRGITGGVQRSDVNPAVLALVRQARVEKAASIWEKRWSDMG